MFVVITGASRGIGKALSYKFAEKGYDLILTCEKNISLLNDIKNDIIKKYNRIVFVKQGLLNDEDFSIFNDDLKKQFSSNKNLHNDLYILINNAGKCDYNLFQDISKEKYNEIIYSNIDYTFFITQLLLKYFIKNKQGLIINISSVWGLYGASFEVLYSMTKGAIISFTKSLAKELSNSEIDVICFALGVVDTDMIKKFSTKDIDELKEKLIDKKIFTPSFIAEKIYEYILYKKYETGDIIEINNGLK